MDYSSRRSRKAPTSAANERSATGSSPASRAPCTSSADDSLAHRGRLAGCKRFGHQPIVRTSGALIVNGAGRRPAGRCWRFVASGGLQANGALKVTVLVKGPSVQVAHGERAERPCSARASRATSRGRAHWRPKGPTTKSDVRGHGRFDRASVRDAASSRTETMTFEPSVCDHPDRALQSHASCGPNRHPPPARPGLGDFREIRALKTPTTSRSHSTH